MEQLYVIECRDAKGALDFSGRQPEAVFGSGASQGVTDWQISRAVLEHAPGRFDECHGTNIPQWPSFIDPRWTARAKTW